MLRAGPMDAAHVGTEGAYAPQQPPFEPSGRLGPYGSPLSPPTHVYTPGGRSDAPMYTLPRPVPAGNTVDMNEGAVPEVQWLGSHNGKELCAHCGIDLTWMLNKCELEDGRAICDRCRIRTNPQIQGPKRPPGVLDHPYQPPIGHALPYGASANVQYNTVALQQYLPQNPSSASDRPLPPSENAQQQWHPRGLEPATSNGQPITQMNAAGLSAANSGHPCPTHQPLATGGTISPEARSYYPFPSPDMATPQLDPFRGTSNKRRRTANETVAQAAANIFSVQVPPSSAPTQASLVHPDSNDDHGRRGDETGHGEDREIPKRARLESTYTPLPHTGGEDAVPPQNTHSRNVILSGQVSSAGMFQHLLNHGCTDLSPHMDPDRYSEGIIAGGAFGDIRKGRLRDGTEVAIKMLRIFSMPQDDPKYMKRAAREIYYWSKAKHTNVQELMGVIMFQGRLGMVSLWMENGNLRDYIGKNPKVDRYSLCLQVVAGVSYLHSCKMTHGDLKAANILVSGDGIAKLSDFDHSIMVECSLIFSETSKVGGGTTRWMAPELILDDKSHRNEHTDIYALGMTLLEIITGNLPYLPERREEVHVIRAVMNEKLPERQPEHLGDNIHDNQMWGLLLCCWSREPTARPKATDVYELLRALIGG